MDLQHYRNFIAIVEEGSLTAASRKIHVAQPALSNQLKAFEKEFGTQLMKRGSRKLELTDTGQILYKKAQHLCELESSVYKEVADCVSGAAGTLRLGLTPSNAATFFEGLLLAFHRQNPDICYELHEVVSNEIIDLLQNGVIEIGIVRTPFQVSSQFEVLHTKEDPMVAVYHKNSAWFNGAGDSLSIVQLKDVPLCVIRRFEPMISDACFQAGFAPNYICVNTQLITNLMWARQGIGAAIVPLSSLEDFNHESLCCKQIEDASLHTRRAVVTVKNRYLSAVAQNFLNLCKKQMN
ncbi:LysR family transcriptional regulator [Hydrogenoanaerobacterium sp.]|uniref:LysR family transcriptional regulator n=1 Tax=Hydrogenoanaerobacterium sp. TaxID=2953763 RepID=UPI00289A3625|nr:LysR family transcriptional regulator [Hydrogenoanaerobacterium sp.]